DRPKFAAKVCRRVRLQVEGIELARPTEQINQHAGVRSASARRDAAGGSRRRRRQAGMQRHAERRQAAEVQHFAPAETVTCRLRLTEKRKHESEDKARKRKSQAKRMIESG